MLLRDIEGWVISASLERVFGCRVHHSAPNWLQRVIFECLRVLLKQHCCIYDFLVLLSSTTSRNWDTVRRWSQRSSSREITVKESSAASWPSSPQSWTTGWAQTQAPLTPQGRGDTESILVVTSFLFPPDVGLCLQVDRAKLVWRDGEDAEFLLCRGGKNRRPVVPGRLPGLLHGLHCLPLHGDALREGSEAALKHSPRPETIWETG